MKKILSLLIFIFCFVTSNTTVAQTFSPSTPTSAVKVTTNLSNIASSSINNTASVPTASITINNAKVVSQSNRDFTLSFDVVNNTNDAIPQTKYVLHLVRVNSATSSSIVDEKVYDDFISLDKKSKISKTINYSILSTLSAGTYNFFLEIGNNSGLALAGTHFSNVQIFPNQTQTIEIVPNTCAIFVPGQVRKGGPLFVSMSDTINEKCQISSTATDDIVLYPKFDLRFHNLFGDFSSSTNGSKDAITIKKGINEVVLTLPKGNIPQDYYATIHFENTDGSIKTNSSSYTYFVEGLTGSIESLMLDKTIYKSGDVASVKVYSLIYDLGAAAQNIAGNLDMIINDESGNACSASFTGQTTLGAPLSTFSTNITKDCTNPTAHIVLSAKDQNGNEVILDTKDYKVITPESYLPIPFTQSLLYKIFISIFAIFVLLIIFTYHIKRRSVINILVILAVISIFSFLGFAKNTSAIVCFPNPADATLSPGSYAGGNGTVFCESTNDSVGMADASGNGAGQYFGWSGRTVSYYPYTGGFVTWPTTNLNGGLFFLCDTNGQYCFKELYQSGYPVFKTLIGPVSASPNPTSYGGKTTISWNSTGAYSCDIYQDGTMLKQAAGNHGSLLSRPITSNSTIRIDCGGYAGWYSSSLNITASPPPSITSSALNNIVDSGATTTISWDSTNENFCSILQNNIPPLADCNSQIACTPFVTGSAITPAVMQLGSYGQSDGQFNNPTGSVVDSQGNIYVADTYNHRIEKFDSYGNFISKFTYTGYAQQSGGNGGQGGPPNGGYGNGSQSSGSTGPFNPTSIAIDSSNNLYVTDSSNNYVEKFVPSGNTYVFSKLFGNSTGEFVAVSYSNNGSVVTSFDGKTWTQQTTPSGNFIDIAYSNGLFVATSNSNNGNLITSPDGITWTQRTSPVGNLTGITYGNGLFVAVSDSNNGSMVTSPDGITWTKRTSPVGILYDVTYGNGLFVATSNSNNGQIVTSTNGTTWTARTSPVGTLNGVVYGNGLFVAVSTNNNGTIATSPDGITWTKRTSPVGTLRSVTYGNGLFVATSYNNNGYITTSPDGTTWTQRSSPAGSLLGINYSNGLFVAVSDNNNGYIVTSPNGTTWTQRTSPVGSLTDVTYGQTSLPYPFNNPRGITVSSSGNIYVADTDNNVIEKFDSSGNYIGNIEGYTITTTSTSWNGKVSTTTTSYTFSGPTSVAVDSSGNIYIADAGNSKIVKLNSSGSYITSVDYNFSRNHFFGTGNDNGQISIDNSGNVFVTKEDNTLTKFDSSLVQQKQFVGNNNIAYSDISINLNDILSGVEALYGVDENNNTVLKYDSMFNQLPFKAQTGSQELSGSKFTDPITKDTKFIIYCTDTSGNISTSSVTVLLKSNITVNISASPQSVLRNNPASISWSSTNANSCTLKKNGADYTGSTAVSGVVSSGRLKTATNFGAICTNSQGQSSDVTTVDIYKMKVEAGKVEWSCDDGTASASMTKNGVDWAPGANLTPDSTGYFEGVISSPDITDTDVFNVKCVAGDGTETIESNGAGGSGGAGGSSCNLVQSGNAQGDNNIYVNKTTTFTMTDSAGSPTNVTWNIAGKTQTGNPTTMIFTTVGSKTISASGKVNGENTSCSTTTTIKLSPGNNQEI